MIHKITRQSIEQSIAEEIMQMDQEAIKNLLLVELMPGTGFMSGLKGIGQGIKGMFQSGRAPAIAQKMAEKYSGELDKLATEFVKSYQNFEKDYKKWGKNKSVSKILDNSGIMDSYNATAGSITNTRDILGQIVQQQVDAQGGKQDTSSDQTPTPEQPGQTPGEEFMANRPADLTEPVLPSARGDFAPPTLDPQHLTELPPEQASAVAQQQVQDKNPNASQSQIKGQADRMKAKAAEEKEEMDLGLEPDEKPKGQTKSQRAQVGQNTPERAKARSKEQAAEKKAKEVAARGYSIKNEELMKKIRSIMQEGKNFKIAPTHKDKALMQKLRTILRENKKIRIINSNGRKK